jgi:hypothetical protein
MKKSNHKRCRNSGNTGQTSTAPSTEKSKTSLMTLIEGPNFALRAASPCSVRDFYSNVDVAESSAQTAPVRIKCARARIELSKQLHDNGGDVSKFCCVECERVAGGGNYTLYLCTYHDDLTLICTYCQELHNAMHELAQHTERDMRI